MKSAAAANSYINYVTGKTAMPTNMVRVVRLWQVLPATDGTGGVEMSGLGYSAYTMATTDFAAAANQQASSLVEINFAPSGASGGGTSFLEGISIHDGTGAFLRISPFPDRKIWDPTDGLKISAGGILLEET